jgi:RNA polymerase primary sigma factor
MDIRSQQIPMTHALALDDAPEVVHVTGRRGVLDETAKSQIYRQWRRGVGIDLLAQEHMRGAASIRKVVNETRATRLLEQKLEYMHDPMFDDPDAAESLLGPMPEAPGGPRSKPKSKATEDLPPYLASLYGNSVLLTREQEAHLFRKMNYLKFRASKLRETLDPERAREGVINEIERLQEEALSVKNQIIRANLRLVVSIAKKRVGPTNNFFELVSDGNMSLIRAVEKFDAGRGFKFSTYASWAIMKNFARSIPEEKTHRERYVTGNDMVFQSAPDHRADEFETETEQRRKKETVQTMLRQLNDREQLIIRSRFGIGGADESTLERIGKQLGITKERVRQIESRAQEKLRKFAHEQKLDPQLV